MSKSNWCENCWSYFRERNGEGGMIATIALLQCTLSDPEFHALAGPDAGKDPRRANTALTKLNPICCRYPDLLEYLKANPNIGKPEVDSFVIKKFGN